MGFRLIFAGLIFFFNPCINIFDILPDFIGCILISAGLLRLADVEDRFYSARRIVNRMIPIYILKLFLSVCLTVSWKSGLLPFTFIYSVGEIILNVLLFANLYGGIEYMANLHDGEKHLSAASSVCKMTVAFSVVKNILAFIPEAFALEKSPEYDFSYNARQPQTLAMAKPYVIVFFTLAVLIFGIYTLYHNAKFFSSLSKDTNFVGILSGIYKERILNNRDVLDRRRFSSYFILMTVSCVLLCDLVIDAVNFIPNILAYALMLVAALRLCGKSYAPKFAPATIILGVFSVITAAFRSVCDSGVNYRMGYESYMAQQSLLVDSGKAIYIGGILALAEGLMFAIFVFIICRSASKEFSQITGEALPVSTPVVAASVFGICSVFSVVTPYIKTMYYNMYINDTLIGIPYKELSDTWELAQGWSNIARFISVVLLISCFIKMRRKADLYLRSENIDNEYE
ncbi:MAG: hypothetical protein IKV97_07245 [Clostridia bacterium]|nr:hypothetical protein [Clostridia bacterium]